MSFSARLDSLVRQVAPSVAARRAEASVRLRRAELQMRALEGAEELLSRGGFFGARNEGQYESWSPPENSADADLLQDLPRLRARSRDLVANDPHAHGLLNTWCDQIIGTNGLVPQSRPDHEAIGITEKQAEDFARAAERVFRQHARSVDVTGRLSQVEQQRLALHQILSNGDVFLIPRFPAGDGIRLRVETVEADRVATPPDRLSDESIREGVKIDARGRAVTYYVKKTHPGDIRNIPRQDDFVPVRARGTLGRPNIYHLYRQERPGQSRGIPFLAPALTWFKDLQQYFRAELIAAKVAACFALFITHEDPFGEASRVSTKTANGKQVKSISPGMVEYLEPGQKPMTANPMRPTSQFNEFVMRILRAIGASKGTPYEIISQDFSETTYTSGRMALTEVRRLFRSWQRWLSDKYCQPFWELLLDEAVLLGEIDIAPEQYLEFRSEYTRATWVGPGWTWVDPQKEIGATVEALKNNLTTLSEEFASRGIDWQEALEQIARERAFMGALGVNVEAPPKAEEENDEPQEEGEEDDDDEGQEEETEGAGE